MNLDSPFWGNRVRSCSACAACTRRMGVQVRTEGAWQNGGEKLIGNNFRTTAIYQLTAPSVPESAREEERPAAKGACLLDTPVDMPLRAWQPHDEKGCHY